MTPELDLLADCVNASNPLNQDHVWGFRINQNRNRNASSPQKSTDNQTAVIGKVVAGQQPLQVTAAQLSSAPIPSCRVQKRLRERQLPPSACGEVRFNYKSHLFHYGSLGKVLYTLSIYRQKGWSQP